MVFFPISRAHPCHRAFWGLYSQDWVWSAESHVPSVTLSLSLSGAMATAPGLHTMPAHGPSAGPQGPHGPHMPSSQHSAHSILTPVYLPCPPLDPELQKNRDVSPLPVSVCFCLLCIFWPWNRVNPPSWMNERKKEWIDVLFVWMKARSLQTPPVHQISI